MHQRTFLTRQIIMELGKFVFILHNQNQYLIIILMMRLYSMIGFQMMIQHSRKMGFCIQWFNNLIKMRQNKEANLTLMTQDPRYALNVLVQYNFVRIAVMIFNVGLFRSYCQRLYVQVFNECFNKYMQYYIQHQRIEIRFIHLIHKEFFPNSIYI